MLSIGAPICRRSDIVVQRLGDEVLIYDLEANKAFCLNETSALVWDLSDGTKSIEQIILAMSQRLKSTVDEEVVWLALAQFKKDNLLADSEAFDQNVFNGMSRREVIRKVGFASMIALPVISTVIAPTAVSAQSCPGGVRSLGENAPCTFSCQCRGRVGAGPGGFAPSQCCGTTTDARRFCKEGQSTGVPNNTIVCNA